MDHTGCHQLNRVLTVKQRGETCQPYRHVYPHADAAVAKKLGAHSVVNLHGVVRVNRVHREPRQVLAGRRVFVRRRRGEKLRRLRQKFASKVDGDVVSPQRQILKPAPPTDGDEQVKRAALGAAHLGPREGISRRRLLPRGVAPLPERVGLQRIHAQLQKRAVGEVVAGRFGPRRGADGVA
jgi:hypothetical protein